jgi:hypothetical protein
MLLRNVSKYISRKQFRSNATSIKEMADRASETSAASARQRTRSSILNTYLVRVPKTSAKVLTVSSVGPDDRSRNAFVNIVNFYETTV